MNTVVKTLLCAITLLSLQQYVGATSQSSEEALSANASDSSPSVDESDSGSSGAAIEIADQNRRREEVNANWRSYFGNFEGLGDGAANFVWGENEIEQLTAHFVAKQGDLLRKEFVVALGVLSMYSNNNLTMRRRGLSIRRTISPLTSEKFIPLLFDYVQREGSEKGLSSEQIAKVRGFIAANIKKFLLKQNARNLFF